jgi:hypothetical protein
LPSFVFDGRGDAVGSPLSSSLDRRRRCRIFIALLLERLAGEGDDLLVLDRQDPVHHLDDRHLGTQRAIERLANSMPIAPEPMTSSDFGIAAGTIASR